MSNSCGKAYGLSVITRMHPLRTFGVRMVFLLIGASMLKPAPRGAVGGVMLGGAIALLLALLHLLGLDFAVMSRLGMLVLAPGVGAWLAGLAIYFALFAVAGAIVGSVYQPKWTILGRISQVQINLTDLSFIHFARWVIIPRDAFPHLDESQPREQLNYDYFFFESNFNGDWEKYIDAFSQVVPGGMDNIWRWSVKYPGSVPISPFLDYIRNCQYDTDYYYSAYPGAATNDVRGALRLVSELEAFQADAAGLPPAQFGRAYSSFLVRVQNCLSKTGPAPNIVQATRAPAGEAAQRREAALNV